MNTETRTEWSVELRGDLGRVGTEYRDEFPLTEDEARLRLAWWREHRPDVESVAVSRTVTITRSEWSPVDLDAGVTGSSASEGGHG